MSPGVIRMRVTDERGDAHDVASTSATLIKLTPGRPQTFTRKGDRVLMGSVLCVTGRRGLLETEQLHRPLTHPHLADLARHRHGELVDHMHVPGDIVVRELSLAELANGLRGERGRAVLHADPHHQLLAVALV